MRNEEWNTLIQKYRNSGQGLMKWCKENKVNVNAMRYQMYGKKEKRNNEIIEIFPVVKHNEPSRANKIMLSVGKCQVQVDETIDFKLLKRLVDEIS